MFCLVPSPIFDGEAELSVPGRSEFAKLNFTWHHKDAVQLKDWSRRIDAQRANDQSTPDQRLALILEVVAGWRHGPLDSTGAPVPFTEAALAELLLRYPGAFYEISGSYIKALFGARAKN